MVKADKEQKLREFKGQMLLKNEGGNAGCKHELKNKKTPPKVGSKVFKHENCENQEF